MVRPGPPNISRLMFQDVLQLMKCTRIGVMLALRARAGLRVISGGVAITQCFRFLSATNSLSFRFYGVGKGTLGIDPPSVVAVPIPHMY